MAVIERVFPAWRDLAIHESSPAERGASARLQRECVRYTSSAFSPEVQLGLVSATTGQRNEDLERLTFPSESFDLFVTQDVMEHVFDAARVFAEIARVLKPGGAHVFTVPLLAGAGRSRVAATRASDGSIGYNVPPEYHGSPTGEGSLVSWHWGYDIADHIHDACGMTTSFFLIDDLALGIRAELNDVLVAWKKGEARWCDASPTR